VKDDLTLARSSLVAFAREHGVGPFSAAKLASVLWPDRQFKSRQGAGAAAASVLKRLNCEWKCVGYQWGGYSLGRLLTPPETKQEGL
jgi:hypothetical protein